MHEFYFAMRLDSNYYKVFVNFIAFCIEWRRGEIFDGIFLSTQYIDHTAVVPPQVVYHTGLHTFTF
jgi:hypothetical protein